MDLPLDPHLALARLRADDLHRQAAHARIVAAARSHQTSHRLPSTGTGLSAVAARLGLRPVRIALARPTGPAVQPCC